MPKKIDVTGQVFGKLTVLCQAPRMTKKEPIKWICQCECGNQTSVRVTDLRNGHTKSCGKCRQRKKDMLGQRFGKLLVIEELPSNKQGDAIWKCQCDCGKIVAIPGRRLRSGGAQSCGCVRIKQLIENNKARALDLTNQKFGELIALESTELRENRKVMWRCRCSCGKEILVSTSNLTSGNTQSCGCQKESRGERAITKLLTEAKIEFERQKTFNDLCFKNGYLARFDFYLPNYNTIIEYDGKQHFVQGSGVYDNATKFQTTQEHDHIKNQYCKKHHISLIRIPYTHIENIDLNDLLPITSTFLID